jgi:SAM-dependent methyltransferase
VLGVDQLLVDRCVCPSCREPLSWTETHATCEKCGQSYPIVDGIPVFALLEADDEHKREQVGFMLDERSEEWEIERPRGGPGLYSWLMEEKFRRSIDGIEDRLPDAVALVACAGSGMDAEFLAQRGARVIASDLSLGAVRRARERARRHGVSLIPLVADVEGLPFGDGGVDVSYVHDGLHHLHDPEIGLREMARVAGSATSVSEPARAMVTRVAIRMGIALEHEEVGNRVERLDPDRVTDVLRASGMRVVAAERYAMFYRHEPGPAMRLLSRRSLLPAARASIEGFNAVLGQIGNKLAVRAVRDRAKRNGSS